MKTLNTPFPAKISLTFFMLLAACLTSGIDEALFIKLNQLSQILPDSWWGFLTTLSDPMVAPLLIFTLFHRKPLFLRAFFISIVLALICNYSLKYGFGIERPTTILDPETFRSIGPIISSPSFPSGHTITIFTLMSLVSSWYQKRSISILVFLLATLISFSRISVGAHWPSDVLFGGLVGIIVGWLALEINSRMDEKILENTLLAAYFIGLFSGIVSLVDKTPYASGQWLSTAVALFTIAYSLKLITELLHRQKG